MPVVPAAQSLYQHVSGYFWSTTSTANSEPVATDSPDNEEVIQIRRRVIEEEVLVSKRRSASPGQETAQGDAADRPSASPPPPKPPVMCSNCHVCPITALTKPGTDVRLEGQFCSFTCAAGAKQEWLSNENESSVGKNSTNDSSATGGIDASCLFCWREAAQPERLFCKKSCGLAASAKAPLLLEAPRSHHVFNSVVEKFKDTWNAVKTCPEVVKVYYIVDRDPNVEKFRTYQRSLEGKKEPPNNVIETRWHRTKRQCSLGDTGKVFPCQSTTCRLCTIILHSFDASHLQDGIPTSRTSSKSDHVIHTLDRHAKKTMLLAEVVPGNSISLNRSEIPTKKPAEFDSVRVIQSANGRNLDEDELIVYTADAIRAKYLVVYR